MSHPEAENRNPIYVNKTVLTLGAAFGVLIVIIGPIMWATRVDARNQILEKDVADLKVWYTALNKAQQDTTIIQTKQDGKLDNILEKVISIQETIKTKK